MKKSIALIALSVFFAAYAKAQDTTRAGIKSAYIDSALVNTSVFCSLSSGAGSVEINQTDEIRSSFGRYNASASSRKANGYKILVYSSNGKNARGASSSIASSLKSSYPHLNVYRSYAAPFFMVHIGDFRNKSDAMKILHDISPAYPQAKAVKSAIGWYAF